MANRFLNNIRINDEYTFPSNDGSAGQAIVTDGSGNLSFGSAIASSADSTESIHISVKNTSGSQILKGTPVYVTGETGNSGKIEIAPADASDSAKMPALGILESTLNDNAEGFCVQGGLLEGLATATIDGTSTTANDTVYVKAGGGLTMTKPTGSNLIQNIAKVARVHASNGSLVVSSILRTNDVPNLNTGKIWVGTATNTAESGVVHLDEGNGRMGVGTSSPSSDLHVIGSIKASGTIGNLTSGSLGQQIETGDASVTTLRFDANRWRLYAGASAGEVVSVLETGNVGIGTTSPLQTFDVDGVAYFRGGAAADFGVGDTPSNAAIIIEEGDYVYTRDNNNLRKLIGKDTSDVIHIGQGGTALIDEIRLIPGTSGGKVTIYNDTAEYVRFDGANQRVGIGTTSPGAKLHVYGSTPTVKVEGSSTNSAKIDLAGTYTTWSLENQYINGATNDMFRIYNSALGSNAITINRNTNNVGIGTGAPDATLHVESTGVTAGGYQYHAIIDDDSSYGTNKGGGIIFRGDYNSSGAKANFAAIRAGKSNSNDGNANAYLSLFYGASGTLAEGIRLDYNGNVGIGTTAPTKQLHIQSSDPTIRLQDSDGADQWGQIRQTAANMVFTTRSGSSNGQMNFQTYDGTTTLNTVTLKTSNQVQFNQYGSGTYTGTATQRLAVDSSGNVIEIPIGSGPVDGSGTANYVTKWSDADTITNSVIYDDGTNIGIGTTSPRSPLSVKSNSFSSANSGITLLANGSTDIIAAIGERSTNGGRFHLYDSGVAKVSFYSDGTDNFIASGNVGIGTTSPRNILDVIASNGKWRITDYGGMYFQNSTDALNERYIHSRSNGDLSVGYIAISNLTGGTGGYASSTYDQLTILSGGNVGIGTTSPSQDLTLYRDSGDTNFLISSNNGASQIFFGDTESDNIGKIDYDHSDDSLNFVVNASERMRITSGGNVGIGTTNPSRRLTIKSITEAAGGGNVELQRGADRSSHQNYLIWNSDSYTDELYIGTAANSSTATIGARQGDINFHTGSYSERMRITSSGNVGIGTTSPSYKLDVNGDGRINGVTFVASGATRSISTHSAAGQLQLNGGTDASNGAFINIAGDSYVTGDFIDYYASKHYFTGNVGIGTTSPATKLHVSNASSNNQLTLERTGTYPGKYTLHTASDNFYIGNTVASTYPIAILSSGNVGIGTTSPAQKLHVSGNLKVTGAYYDSNNSAGTSGQVLSSTATGTDWVSLSEISGVDGTGTANYVTKWSDADTITNSVIYDNGANIGIGTTSPGAKLHVASTDSSFVAKFSHTTATGYAPGSILLQAGQGTSRGQGLFHYNTEADESWFTGVPYNVTSRKWIVANKPDTTFNPDVAQLSYALLTIDSDNGNVGIGTASPGVKLDVAGDTPIIRLTDTRNMDVGAWDDVTLGKIQFYTSDTTSPGPRSIAEIEAYSGANAASGPESELRFNTLASSETNPSTKMVVQALGNVGIGTTDPTFKLQVQGTLYSTSATFGVNGGDRITISNRANNDVAVESHAAELFLSSGYNGISFEGSANTTLMKLTDSGNLGIGTTSPAKKLEVNGTVHLGSSGNDVSIGSSSSSVIFMLRSGYNYIQASDASGALMFRTGGANNRMIIDSSGDVGIGTTSPSSRLHVVGANLGNTSGNEVTLANIKGARHNLEFKNLRTADSTDWNSTTYRLQNKVDTTNMQSIDFVTDASYNRHVDINTASNAFNTRFTHNGRVGIKTASPAGTLDVNGSYYIKGDEILANDGTNNYIKSNDALYFQTSAGAQAMIINGSQKVGIGTTSPSYKLHATGGALVGGKVSYVKNYSSLDTTGNAVAGIDSSFNGASAMFTFTCFGHVGGYQKIVYSCYNAGGTWNTKKVIDEGTNDFDIEASANAATITFTFKSTSGTKSYSPKVVVEAAGSAINSTYA